MGLGRLEGRSAFLQNSSSLGWQFGMSPFSNTENIWFETGDGGTSIRNGLELIGSSTNELSLNALAGNPDVSFFSAGVRKAQLKFSTADDGLGLFVETTPGAVTEALHIDRATAQIGIGTNNVRARLHIRNVSDGADYWSGLRFDPALHSSLVTRAHHKYHKIVGFRREGLWLGGSNFGSAYLKSNIMLTDAGVSFGMSDGFLDPEQNVKLFVANGGNIGIGTSTPTTKFEFTDGASKLHIHQSTAGGGVTDISAGTTGSVRIGAINLTSNSFGGAGIQAWSDAGAFAGNLYLESGHSASASIHLRTGFQTKMFVKKDGKVGIGTTAPTELLDVAGNIKCASLTQTSDLRLKKIFHPLKKDYRSFFT